MAPGDNLEFNPSKYYSSRIEGNSQIDDAIRDKIKNKTDIGVEIAPGIREFGVAVGNMEYVVIYGRKGNRIGLTGIFRSNETDLLNEKRVEIRKLFGSGGRK